LSNPDTKFARFPAVLIAFWIPLHIPMKPTSDSGKNRPPI
jgi:hypothetical protein